MNNYARILLPAGLAVILFLGSDFAHVQSVDAEVVAQDVSIVSPLTNNGSVPVEATIKGIVKTRANPALAHVGALASDVVVLVWAGVTLGEIRGDGTRSTFTAVPAGRALVITDIEFAGSGNPGDAAAFQLTATSPGNSAYLAFRDYDKFDTNGYSSRRANMTTGLAFPAGTTLDVTAGNSVAYLRGYYIDMP